MQKMGVSLIYRALAFAALGIGLALWFGTARADAVAELCPASVERMSPGPGASRAPSASFTYELRAKTVRTIDDAAVIADTDHGWYRWGVTQVAMPMTVEDVATPRFRYTTRFARSTRLEVVFPEPLLVYRSWILSAKSTDEASLGWAKRGEYRCQVPAFQSRIPSAKELAADKTLEQAIVPVGTPSPVPSPAQPAVAVPTTMSLDTIACSVPFRVATVDSPQSPDFPNGSTESMLETGSAEVKVEVEVTLDEEGRLLDASVFAGSGIAPFDLAALRAARKSGYSGAVSYCEKVRGQYIFSATFQ
jgi:Gram-negative bacterial TonB protein C-terminal